MDTKQQPEAQERKFWKRLCALNRFSFFYMGGGVARASDKSGNWIEVHSAQEIVDDAECEVSTQHARITELESQLAQRFDAADMATASAQGFRDGVASLSANAGEPRNAIDRDALIDAIAQGLHGTWHCTRVWEAWHVGTMSQDDFEPVDESETPTEIADAVLFTAA